MSFVSRSAYVCPIKLDRFMLFEYCHRIYKTIDWYKNDRIGLNFELNFGAEYKWTHQKLHFYKIHFNNFYKLYFTSLWHWKVVSLHTTSRFYVWFQHIYSKSWSRSSSPWSSPTTKQSLSLFSLGLFTSWYGDLVCRVCGGGDLSWCCWWWWWYFYLRLDNESAFREISCWVYKSDRTGDNEGRGKYFWINRWSEMSEGWIEVGLGCSILRPPKACLKCEELLHWNVIEREY